MNAKTKTIIAIIVALILVMGLIGYVYAQSNNNWSENKLYENCFTLNSVDACNEYIKLQQSEYHEVANELETYSGNANKAREVIQSQLSWTFM